jgi:hypothetical protein
VVLQVAVRALVVGASQQAVVALKAVCRRAAPSMRTAASGYRFQGKLSEKPAALVMAAQGGAAMEHDSFPTSTNYR